MGNEMKGSSKIWPMKQNCMDFFSWTLKGLPAVTTTHEYGAEGFTEWAAATAGTIRRIRSYAEARRPFHFRRHADMHKTPKSHVLPRPSPRVMHGMSDIYFTSTSVLSLSYQI